MFKATGSGNSSRLLQLADLLEQGKPILSELAKPCSELIRDAVLRGGKLDLGKQAGRPTAHEERVERALAVGHLMGTEGISEAKAKTKLAERLEIGPRSIANACKKYPFLVDVNRRIAKSGMVGKLDNLVILLRSFRDQKNGRPYSQDEIEEMRRLVPFEVIGIISEKIEKSVHRDRKLLLDILASEGILFGE